MTLESDLAVFAIGSAGGIANELLHWWGLRRNKNLPVYAWSPVYWALTLGMVVLGGLLAWLQLGTRADGLVAFQLGLAAPLLLQKLIATAPTSQGAMGTGPSARDFLGG